MSAQITEAHRALATELCRNATGSNRALHHVPKFAQAIADSEARAVAGWVKLNTEQMGAALREAEERAALELERDTLRADAQRLSAECERLRKDAADYTQWIACKMLQPEWDSFKKSLEVIDHWKKRAEKSEAGEASLRAELVTERARLQAVVNSCWSVHKGNENMFAVYCRTRGGYITPWVATDRAAIDAAMKERK